jgi:hypothetical protein
VIKLEQNYRSTGAHPQGGQRRDRQQREAVREEAVVRARHGDPITVTACKDNEHEAESWS